VLGSSAESELVREVGGLALEAGRGCSEEVAGELADGWAACDFFGRDVVGGAEGEVAVFVLAALQKGAGGVDEQACFAFGDGDFIEG
jgi:hypothetical protein